MARPHLAALAAALAILALTIAAGGAFAQSEDAPLRPVRLTEITPPRTVLSRTFFGQVEARQTVDLAFQVGGQITRFPVDNGQIVAEGDLLAQLDLDPFDRALDRARTNLDQANRGFDRARDLAAANAGTEVRLDDARTGRDLAQLELQEAEDALDDATLTAPFDGLVARRLVAAFSTVEAGMPVLRLHDMSELRVRIDVPEQLVSQASDWGAFDFRADLGVGLTDIPLTVAEFTAQTEGVAQSYEVDLALPPLGDAALLPGRTAEVTMRLDRDGGDALSVPATALVGTPDGAAQVFVFQPDRDGAETGHVRATPVTIVTRDGAMVAIAAGEALSPGTEVVATGAHLLTADQRVRRFSGYDNDG